MVGLVPARGGSKRVPGKNTKLLAGKPLIFYTLEAALESGVFSRVMVSSDDDETLRICGSYNVLCLKRPAEFATDESPDIEWVRHALGAYSEQSKPELFSILRPTSPFRTAETIKRAYKQFVESGLWSMRAVERWRGPHPGKMWDYDQRTCRIRPLLFGWKVNGVPYHSFPSQGLHEVYVQNASLEMASTRLPLEERVICRDDQAPFFTEGLEGFDINTPDDWNMAELHLKAKEILASV